LFIYTEFILEEALQCINLFGCIVVSRELCLGVIHWGSQRAFTQRYFSWWLRILCISLEFLSLLYFL